MAGICCVARNPYNTPSFWTQINLLVIESEWSLAFTRHGGEFCPRKCIKTVVVWTWVVPQRLIFEKFDPQLGIFEKQYKLEGRTLWGECFRSPEVCFQRELGHCLLCQFFLLPIRREELLQHAPWRDILSWHRHKECSVDTQTLCQCKHSLLLSCLSFKLFVAFMEI